MSVGTVAIDPEPGCVFCEIAAGTAPAKHRGDWISTIIFEPLNPVTPGHLLVAPRMHVRDAVEHAAVAASTMSDAASCVSMLRRIDPAYESVNLITSVGAPATQTVFHLHIHIVPRRAGDDLALPWSEPADPVRCPKCGGPHPFHDPACVVHPDLIQDHNEQEQ